MTAVGSFVCRTGGALNGSPLVAYSYGTEAVRPRSRKHADRFSVASKERCRAVLLLIPSFAWSLKAAAAAGRMKDIGHSQPWLIDDHADVCRKWLPETDLPPLLRQWKRTDTRRKPRTFSGIDFEMQNLRADAGGKGIPILALRSDADFNAVMRVPELVLRYDWPALARETGVYTNEKHLRDLIKCCFEKSLTEAALKERGRQQLLAQL